MSDHAAQRAKFLKQSQSWHIARSYVLDPDDLFPSFTIGFVRALMREHRSNGQRLGDVGRFTVSRLLRAPTPRGCFQGAANAYHGDKLESGSEPNLQVYEAIYSPYDMACILGFIFLYIRAKRICTEEFEDLEALFIRNQHLGILVGRAMPAIGFGTGMLMGGIHSMAMCSYYRLDPQGYFDYRRYLTERNMSMDPEYELCRWGCTSTQMGALLLQSFGFGITVAVSFLSAFSGWADQDGERSRLTKSMRICWTWIESLRKTNAIPSIVHDGSYYPTQSALESLLSNAAKPIDREEFWMLSHRPQRTSVAEVADRPMRRSIADLADLPGADTPADGARRQAETSKADEPEPVLEAVAQP